MIDSKYLLGNSKDLKSYYNQNKLSPELIITSPPYYDVLNYNHKEQIGHGQTYDEYLSDISDILQDCYAISTDNASLWIVIDTFKKDGEIKVLPFDIIFGYKKRTFIDNIIVSLPADVKFQKLSSSGKEGKEINILNQDIIENIQIKIPYKINSVGIIDGQHRIYGHYESNDSLEKQISLLRNKRHLLVTGLFYDRKKFSEIDKRKFESELFLQINNEQKKVGKTILQYIKSLQDPYSSIGVANNVLISLNRRSPFLNLFILSPLDTKGIKTPTIIQYGLQDLVEISDTKETLFKYWNNIDKMNLLKLNNDDEKAKVYEEYVKFCVSSLSIYFSAVQTVFNSYWNLDQKNKLLTVTSIVGFLISFRRVLEKHKGVKDHNFYSAKIRNLKVDFTKEKFPFVSSQWPKLVEEILKCL